jgi:predicted AAA+ superfamily ATPase
MEIKLDTIISRPYYLQTLSTWKDSVDIIKIMTGIRRTGKSKIFDIYQHWLTQNGVSAVQIIDIDFEEAEPLANLLDWKKLYDYIISCLIPNKMNYVFLDEIQVVPDFQLAVNAVRKLSNVDLYLTGSNSGILSGDLATRLSGRYVAINMLPLSFAEYVSAYPLKNRTTEEKFNDYIHNGGFPYSVRMTNGDTWDRSSIRMLIGSIWNTIIVKDLISRQNIREVERLEKVVRFLFDNIGSETSISRIANVLTERGMKIEGTTIESWLNGLLDAFVLYKANRYDIKGKQILKTNAKYYVSDIGLRYFMLGSEGDIGHILENIVYLELRRREFDEIYVGKIYNSEVDFVVKRGSYIEYYQVAHTLNGEKTMEREYKSLNAINDHHPKYILTNDRLFPESKNGIRILNVLDWLLGKE